MENKLPEGWEWKKLGEIGDYINGKAFKPSEWAETGKPIVRIQNLTDSSKPFNCFDGECEEKYHLKNDDILISWSASLGVFVWEGGDALLNQHIFKAIPEEKIIDKRYFVYVVKTVIEKMGSLTHGSTMKHIVKSDFNDTKIPVPPLETQQKIVSILEKAEETKKLRAQADVLTQKLLQSVFLEMFGDPVKNSKQFDIVQLKSVFSEKKEGTKCGPFGSALKKHEYVEDGIPVWTMDNITENKFTRNGCLFITEEKYQELKAYSVSEGDILISRAGTVGKMCVVNSIDDPSIISTNLIRLSLNPSKIEAIYFTSLMTYFKGKMGRLKTGEDGTYTFMNTGILKDLRIPLPPFEIQRSFAKIVEQVEKTRYSQQQSSLKINTLFDALMQKAFTGELVS